MPLAKMTQILHLVCDLPVWKGGTGLITVILNIMTGCFWGVIGYRPCPNPTKREINDVNQATAQLYPIHNCQQFQKPHTWLPGGTLFLSLGEQFKAQDWIFMKHREWPSLEDISPLLSLWGRGAPLHRGWWCSFRVKLIQSYKEWLFFWALLIVLVIMKFRLLITFKIFIYLNKVITLHNWICFPWIRLLC